MRRLATGGIAIFVSMFLLSSLQVAPAVAAGATLCKANETPCGSHYALGTQFLSNLKPGTFLRKVIVVEQGEGELSFCEGTEGNEASQIGGHTTTTGSESAAVEMSIGPLTFGRCSCKNEVLKNGTFRIEHIPGTMNGNVTWSGFEIREPAGSWSAPGAVKPAKGSP